MRNYDDDTSKSRPKIKLAHLSPKAIPRLRLGGTEPADDMPAGEYRICCEGASKKSVAAGTRVELKYRVIDGPHAGTALRQWITVDASGVISPKSRYAQQCLVALGRPIEPFDNLDDPASIFSGALFSAYVGFRKTAKPRGGTATAQNALNRKDDDDGLRVHDLLARVEM